MGLFDFLKKNDKPNEKEQSYLEVNYNKFHYTDAGIPEKLSFLQGQIRRLTQFFYAVEKNELLFESSTAVFTYIFDRQKKIIEKLSHRSETQVSRSEKFLDFQNDKKTSVINYRDTGLVASKEEYDYNDKKECVSFIKYFYDENGEEIKSEQLFLDKSDKCFRKKIVEGGSSRVELFNSTFYNPLKPPVYENLGEDGFRQTIELHDSTTTESFDKYRNFITSRRFDKDGNPNIEIEVSYDNNFRRKTYSLYDYENKTKRRIGYHYDNDGFLIKIDNPNIESDVISYENDKFGNVIKKFTSWRKSTPEEEFEYEYDDTGNWTKRTMKYREKIINVTVRELEYY